MYKKELLGPFLDRYCEKEFLKYVDFMAISLDVEMFDNICSVKVGLSNPDTFVNEELSSKRQ